MIKAADKRVDKFTWGEAEQFHVIETDENSFRLSDIVVVITEDDETILGEIGYIGENAFDILPQGRPVQTIRYAQIKKITK